MKTRGKIGSMYVLTVIVLIALFYIKFVMLNDAYRCWPKSDSAYANSQNKYE
jgi:hypothetical protein